jgi:hypothetical protein
MDKVCRTPRDNRLLSERSDISQDVGHSARTLSVEADDADVVVLSTLEVAKGEVIQVLGGDYGLEGVAEERFVGDATP